MASLACHIVIVEDDGEVRAALPNFSKQPVTGWRRQTLGSTLRLSHLQLRLPHSEASIVKVIHSHA
jgi:hypothetical protein